MPFHKHPINFDACKYIAHCSGGRWRSASVDTDAYPEYVIGSGREARAAVILLDGTSLTNHSLYLANSGNSNTWSYIMKFISVFSRFLDNPRYYYMTKTFKSSLCANENGNISHLSTSRAGIGSVYCSSDYNLMYNYGTYVYYQAGARIMYGLTDEYFDESKNDYELLQCVKSGSSITNADILYNANNGNTQIRITLGAYINEDVTIKGMPLYTTAHAFSGSGNGSVYPATGSCGTKISDAYLVNIGYVEFDTPIEATANVPFTVDVIFEFET